MEQIGKEDGRRVGRRRGGVKGEEVGQTKLEGRKECEGKTNSDVNTCM